VTYPGRVDRDAIERRDFPIGRRGYDQAAVDDHLRRVADEFEALHGRPPAPAASLAAGASEQVRVILEAAEAGAAQLREDAGRRAGEHVTRVEEATGGMLAHLDELERELGSLLAALRRSGERLTEGLARLHGQVGRMGGAADEPADDVSPAAAETAGAAPEPAAGLGAAGKAPLAAAPSNGDEAGARLIALNMALSGTPREETARYLAEHFALADADGLLDDVYSRAGQ